LGQRLACVKAIQRIDAQVAIQGVEGEMMVGYGVLQDDGWAVVERGGVVAKAVNDAVQGCQDRRTGFHENVEAKMDRAPFGAVVAFALEQVAGVNRAGFVVPADAYLAVRGSHTLKDMASERFDSGYLHLVAQFAAANTQVED